ncbi:MAG: glycosyltransferase family 2 protein [Oscillospiraceae bacterium]|nr:glycosyltransferase family 2 protein [Oscillospiraceae bacterium]
MKFSVIVPVYRTGEYLDQCVRSVLSQSCRDLELILVDDCSPDHCGRLCDEYAATDPRVRVIHKPVNEGLGFARNTGLEAAQGDFILFLDSDDWLRCEALSRCDALTDADILVFGTSFVYEKNGKEEIRCPEAVTADTEKEKADAFAMLTRARIFQFAWNKLYRREFLLQSGVLFEKTPLIEDFLFNIALLPKAQSIRCISDPLHFYRKPTHETLASKYSPEFFALSKRKYLLEAQLLTDAGAPEHLPLVYEGYLKHLLSAGIRNTGLPRQVRRQQMLEMLDDPVTLAVVRLYPPRGTVFRLLTRWVRLRRTGLLLALCRALSIFKHI